MIRFTYFVKMNLYIFYNLNISLELFKHIFFVCKFLWGKPFSYNFIYGCYITSVLVKKNSITSRDTIHTLHKQSFGLTLYYNGTIY